MNVIDHESAVGTRTRTTQATSPPLATRASKSPSLVRHVCMLALVGLVASIVAMVGSVSDAEAQLIDPATQVNAPTTGPAQFFPAPNPNPYCDSSFVFPAWPGNEVVPTAPLPPVQEASAGGVTATMTFTADGDPADVYPGSYGGVDQTKGFEFAGGDAATVALSEPLFYSQWVFTDVDKANEGFILQPSWVTAGPNAAAIIVGEANTHITFDPANTENLHEFNHPPSEQWQGYELGGRVQVDYFGAINALNISRPADGDGQSGFALGGGCVAAGVSKRLAAAPVWNGTSFEVTYEIKVRNNLPSTATLRSILDFAEAAATTSAEYGSVEGIALTALTLSDDLADPRFSQIDVVSLTNPTGGLTMNTIGYDGITDTNMINGGANVPADTEETVLLVVDYTPDRDSVVWTECVAPLELLNTAEFIGSAGGVDVSDMSDDGINPNPADNNGIGGVDDPTLALFDCPAELEIVKTVVAAGEDCPTTFIEGIIGDGPVLAVEEGDTVHYCIAIRNVGLGAAVNVTVSDPLLGFVQNIALLPAGDEVVFAAQPYVVPVGAPNPLVNTATAIADNAPEVTDPAVVSPDPLVASISLEKTVLVGADADCSGAVEGDDELVSGDPGTAVTYCFVVTNTGTVHLMVAEVADSTLGVMIPIPAANQLLAPGTTVIVSYAATITDNLVNTASVTGDPVTETGDPIPELPDVTDDNDAEVTLDLVPGIRLEKTVVTGVNADCSEAVEGVDELVSGAVGTAVTYCFTVTNTGNTHLLVTEVVDATLGVNIAIAAADQLLAPGVSVTVSHNATITGDLVNTASVTGDPVDENGDPIPDTPDVTDDNDAEVDEPPAPGVALSKTVLAGADADCSTAVEGVDELVSAVAGTAVTYCFTVTNTGNTHLLVVEVVDSTLGVTIPIAVADQQLAPAESLTVSHNDTLSTSLVNTATVTGDPVDESGDPIPEVPDVTDDDDAEVKDPLGPAIELSKTVLAGTNADCSAAVEGDDEFVSGPGGTAVTYCFTVTNTGGTYLSVSEVSDDTLGISVAIAAADQLMAPGDSVTVSHNGVIDGDLVNTASVTGTPTDETGNPLPDAPDVIDDDDAEVDEPSADLSVVKTVSDRTPARGQQVTYTITVSNAGPDSAADVRIVDTLPNHLSVVSLPSNSLWDCSASAGRIIDCARSGDLAANSSDTLTYVARVETTALVGVGLVNVVNVTSSTPDPDLTDNQDTETVIPPSPAAVPVPVTYAGPTIAPPADEVLSKVTTPLAVTGSGALEYVTVASLLVLSGGAFVLGARRRRDDDTDAI